MNPSEIKQLADVIAQNTWQTSWVPLLVAAVVVGVAAFFGTYLAEKAKNTATREDVTEITRRIESVRVEYTEKVESMKGSYQLRVAALDRRLEIHQQAFARWRGLVAAMHTTTLGTVARECDDWWGNHCLYLSSEARDAFIKAVNAATHHDILLKPPRPIDKIEANWKKIIAAGDAIMKGADLPPLPSEAIPPRPVE